MRRHRVATTAIATAVTTAVVAAGLLAAVTPSTAAAPAASGGQAQAARLPVVTPTPQSMTRAGTDTTLPTTLTLVVGEETDAPARDLLVRTLQQWEVKNVKVATKAPRQGFSILLGPASRADLASRLRGTEVPTHAEGYALRVDAGARSIALGGVDGAGQYYAVQTLRQLIGPGRYARSRPVVAGASVSDFPSMPLRGAIEGFYGEPWTNAERLDQLGFYGDLKANTYVYAPKDDPFHRDRWREPYPADELAELTALVGRATANHVRFTFALSPGNTVCYSSDADYRAVVAKFQQVYDVGVRAFNLALDDIDLGRWSCAEDQAAFGDPNPTNAGRAQAQLITRLQQEWIETHDGARPLQMVPTEYYNTEESGYKAALRTMDEDVVVMWTGNDVVPQSISVEQAQQADQVFGGPTFLWDNYPVNDYGQTSGRLLLGPYVKREPGLSDHLAGIVSNPMNQAAASKIAVTGIVDFAWNDRGYDAGRSWVESMRYLAGDDPAATGALQVFADLNHLAPSFGDPWQPQAPVLQARIDLFWAQWESGDRERAITELRAYTDRIEAAPTTIRAGSVDPGFVADATPWLDATVLWGEATTAMLDALQADLDGDQDRAQALAATSRERADAASAVLVDPPDNRWGVAPVKVADGVLDVFLTEAGQTLAR